jgi:predicted ATP-grasp superfamily ATP-dependent carboligase
MINLPTAIVLGVDTPIGLAVMRELGSHGVPVHGVGRRDAIGRASRWCNGFTVRPDGPLATWLPDVIRRSHARTLLAVSERDLLDLAELDPVIERCHILTPRNDKLAMVLDKLRTMEIARDVGIDTPDSWQPASRDDFARHAGQIAYPVILKWADPPSILPRLEKLGLSFEKAERIDDAASLVTALARYDALKAWPVVQQFCPGTGLGQMFHRAGDRITLAFQHERLHEWPPEGGVSTLCASLPLDFHAPQRAKSEALLRVLDWQGPAMVEYRYDAATSRYWLMEINGRFWGSLPLCAPSGVNFAWETYRSALFGGIEPQPGIKTRRARYMIPETRRLGRVLAIGKPFSRFDAVVRYVSGFVDVRMRYFVWQWSDPGPFLTDMYNVMWKALRRGMRSPDGSRQP